MVCCGIFWSGQFEMSNFVATLMDKILGTLLRFWGVFQFIQLQPLPSPHKQCWTRVSRIFSEFQLYIGWGGGRKNWQKISKMMHCFKREPRNDRKIWILQYCPKDFCPGLSESWFWGKRLLYSFFLCFLGILETSRWLHAIIMTFETISST